MASQPDRTQPSDRDRRPRGKVAINVRSIALPTEHGGWGFTIEPILLGLLVAPSTAGWALAAAALGVFLARRPIKLVSTDLLRRRWLPRTTVAAAFGAAYGLLAILGAAVALATTDGPFWVPIIVAVPFALFALRADAQSRNRTLFAEVSGAIAMGTTVAAIAVADGWDYAPAFGLWLVLAARDVASIVLVRGQVRRLHDRSAHTTRILIVAAAATGVVAIAAAAGIVPWLGVLAVALVGAVAAVSLRLEPVPAKVIGWTQMALGLAVALITAAGVRLGI